MLMGADDCAIQHQPFETGVLAQLLEQAIEQTTLEPAIITPIVRPRPARTLAAAGDQRQNSCPLIITQRISIQDRPPKISFGIIILDHSPKTRSELSPRPKSDLHQIYNAESRTGADEAFDRFIAKYGAKYEKAGNCLVKDRDTLLAFYGVPAEHWQHVRSTNPIESTFSTVRLRTNKTRGCLSRDTALAMVIKLVKSAERH